LQVVFIIFAAAAAIQLIYFVVFLIALYGRDKGTKVAPVPVSVIVCAHDEEQNLRELIPILLKQNYPSVEIIVVNDRSNDGTYDYLLEETQKHERLRMVHITNKPDHINGKKYAITLGVRAAKHEWILLTDADCRPTSPEWIKLMSERCSDDKEIVLGYSPYTKQASFLNLFIRFETLYTAIQYLSFAWLGNPYMGVGRNMAYRKSLFLKHKGFDGISEITGGDDDLFVNRYATSKNVAVVVGEHALTQSIPKTTWGDFFNQKIRHLAVGKHYKFRHKLVLGLFSVTGIVTWLVGIVLLFNPVWFPWASSALILRTFLFSLAVYEGSDRFGHKFEFWAVPILDFLFVIYYLSTAPIALLTKKLQWRN
jgi:glycosyltransferase involved in cell wall biosynthesis